MINTFKYIACCLAVGIAILPLQAQNIIRPLISGPGKLWVNSFNGVLFFEQADFETQSSAMTMKLSFYYNSSASEVDYGYGLGFSMGYEMRYREDVIGGVDIISGDGRTDHFAKYGDEYKAPAGVFSTLVRPTFDTYLLTTKDGTKYFFDNANHRKVTAIEDRYGSKTTFKYQDTLLVEVKDAVGHTITLNYNDGLLTQSSATFSPGKYRYEYDGLRRLRKRIDPMGNVTLYDYSRQNKLDEIIDANGNKTLIAYNDAGMVSRLKTDVSDKSIRYEGDKTVFIDYTEPNNVYSYYRWDDKGRAIEKVGLCCGIQLKLKYDNDDNVAQQIDANGNTTNFTYDEHGNMLSIKDPLGFIEQYTYEPSFNQVASYRDKNGNSYTFSYDTHGNLSAMNGPLNLNNRYSYDDHGWLTMAIDSNGGITRTNYNPDGTKASVINADGGTTSFIYDTYGRLTSITDAMGNKTSYTYDLLGHVITQADALDYKTSVTYDKAGNIVRVQDAKGNITAYTYNALGYITSITDAMGGETLYQYDGRGNIIRIVDPLGIIQEVTYNDRNKVVSHTNGEGEKTEYDYDRNGNLIAILQSNGNVISYNYDELNRINEISDNIGLIASYEYDGNGNCLSIADNLGRKMTYSYDAMNRKITETSPSGSNESFEYDSNGNLVSMTDALGRITRFTYDVMNRKSTEINALNAKTQYVYDYNGNMTKIIDAKGNATSYSYDAMNHNTDITFANGRSLQYTYNELGQLVFFKDRAGNEFRFDFNPLGKLLSKIYPDGSKDKFTYDANSRMLSAENSNALITFLYDRAGRIKSESLNGKATFYTYDVVGGKRTLTYPSGMKVVEQYNVRNLISDIYQNGEAVISMSYNGANQKTSQTYGNGITTSYGYNENDWLISIKDNHNIINYEMDYDMVGNMSERRDVLDADRTEYYHYDAINQLIKFSRGTSENQMIEFDALGNRIKMIENGVVTNYSSNNVNSYTSISGDINLVPQYDENGNLLIEDTHVFDYDYNNKLIRANENEEYKYDALGRRIVKNNTFYYYVGEQMVEEVCNGTTKSYVFGNSIDEIILMKYDNSVYYYHTNHLGSTMAISDSHGTLKEKLDYGIYGKPSFYNDKGESITESSINNSILYSGHEYDSEIEASFFRNRHLSNKLGRFFQKDNLIYKDGLNDYTYVCNSPIKYVDPYGQFVQAIAIPLYVVYGQAAIDFAAISLGLYYLSHPIQPVYHTTYPTSRTQTQNNNNDPCKNFLNLGFSSEHLCRCSKRNIYPNENCDEDKCKKEKPNNSNDPNAFRSEQDYQSLLNRVFHGL